MYIGEDVNHLKLSMWHTSKPSEREGGGKESREDDMQVVLHAALIAEGTIT